MLAISTCPRCQKSVSIPNGIDSDAVVRCPLCNAEYRLGEAIPPVLVPVLVPKAENSAPAAEATDDGFITIPLEPGDELVESTETEDQLTIEPSSTEELSSENAEAETYGLAERPVDQTGEDSEKEEEESEAVAMIGRVSKTAARPRRRQKSGLQKLIEVVTSGLAGLLMGYYALAFFYGPGLKSMGFPILTYLPGIERLTTPPEKSNGSGENVKSPADASKPKPANGNASPKTSDLPKEPPKTSPEPPAQQASVEKPADQPPPNKAPSETMAPMPEVKETATPEVKEAAKEAKLLRPKLGTAEYVGPRTPKLTTSDQLGKALEEAAGKAEDLASADAYESLCRLGETLAFVNGDAADTQLTDRIAAAKTTLETIAKQSEAFDKLAETANARIDTNAGQNVGVLLVGTVKSAAKQKQIYGAMVELAGQSKTVSVLSNQESELKVDDKVVVLGIVVREPGANVVGYSGSKSAVVWAAMLVKVP
jgi:hypothetical protein